MGKAPALRFAVNVANAAFRAAFAPPCAVCATLLESPLDGCVCPRCWAGVEPPPVVPWPVEITVAAAGGDYVGSLRDIVHAFKYGGRRSLSHPLAALMREHGCDVLTDATHVVPVPLHPFRRLRRGFNQATDLARHLGKPIEPLLWRRRLTRTQAELPAAQRRRNVHRAFELAPYVSRRRRDAMRGAIIVLVDDVRTTGATLQACAEAWRRSNCGKCGHSRQRCARTMREMCSGMRHRQGHAGDNRLRRCAHKKPSRRPGGVGQTSSGSTVAKTSAATCSRSRSASSRTQLSVICRR